MKFRENALELAVGKPTAVVLDSNDDLALALLRADPHHGSARRVLRAVLEQVASACSINVASTRTSGKSSGQLHDDAMCRHALAQPREHRSDDLIQGRPIAVHLDRPRFETRHLQHLRYVLGHVARLVEDALAPVLDGLLRLTARRFPPGSMTRLT